ncbi:MAG: ABC transporter substrate-binding protein, partial [Phycisphaerales bacterium]
EWTMKNLWGALLVFLIVCQCVNAKNSDPNDPNYPRDPNELLRTKWDAVFSVLRNKDIDQREKEKKINKIITPIFDFPLMAKLTLGRKHWPTLTGEQQEKFTRLFVERLKTSYREKVSLYTDERVQFKPAVENKEQTVCFIPMEMVSKDKKINIRHKLHKGKVDRRWKIYDVEIQGISILLTYRSQFDDILQKGTIEDLLVRLEDPPAQ